MSDLFAQLALLKKHIEARDEFEFVSIQEAKNRVLFEDISANFDSPSFSNSALDGYVFAFKDKDEPLNIKGSIFAGDFKEYELGKNEAYKIMTGAKIPNNADTVLMIEDELIKDNKLIVKKDIKAFNAVRIRGEEFKKGEILLKKGEILNSARIALLASQGISKLKVAKKLNIAVFSSGNEVVEPSQKKEDFQIYNANASAIIAMLGNENLNISYLGIIKDKLDSIKQALGTDKYDIVITSGGASVGEADFMKQALEELSFKEIFSKTEAKFIKPTKLFCKNSNFVLVLPGNTVSALFSLFFFAKTLIFSLLGANFEFEFISAKCKDEIRLKNKRNNILLGELENGYFIPDMSLSAAKITVLARNSYIFISDYFKESIKENEELKLIKMLDF